MVSTLDPVLEAGDVIIFDEYSSPANEYLAWEQHKRAFMRKAECIGMSDQWTQGRPQDSVMNFAESIRRPDVGFKGLVIPKTKFIAQPFPKGLPEPGGQSLKMKKKSSSCSH